jgi:hypothetical protein
LPGVHPILLLPGQTRASLQIHSFGSGSMDRKDKLPDVNESSMADTTLQPHTLPIRSDYVNFGHPSLPIYRNPCYFTMDLRLKVEILHTPIMQVLSISPNIGSTLGGTAVSITGTDFAQGAVVTFSGIPATNVVVVSPTLITALTPA